MLLLFKQIATSDDGDAWHWGYYHLRRALFGDFLIHYLIKGWLNCYVLHWMSLKVFPFLAKNPNSLPSNCTANWRTRTWDTDGTDVDFVGLYG